MVSLFIAIWIQTHAEVSFIPGMMCYRAETCVSYLIARVCDIHASWSKNCMPLKGACSGEKLVRVAYLHVNCVIWQRLILSPTKLYVRCARMQSVQDKSAEAHLCCQESTYLGQGVHTSQKWDLQTAADFQAQRRNSHRSYPSSLTLPYHRDATVNELLW